MPKDPTLPAQRLDAEHRYHDLYENMPVMYFEMDDRGCVVTVNAFGAEQLGYTPEELVGRSVMGIFHEEDREAVGQQFHSLTERGGLASWEFRKRRKDGSVLWVRETARALQTSDGRREVIVVCQDITPRKLAEEKQREAEELVRQLSLQLDEAEERERRRIAVHLHDDVGQILALVQMKLDQLVECDRSKAAKVIEIKDVVHRAIESTRSLTFELASPVLYELGLVEALDSLCDRPAKSGGTRFRFELAGDAQSVPERLVVPLYKIACELVFNVRKHARAQEASVRLECTDGQVSLAVQDDGRGFDPASLRSTPGKPVGIGLFSIEQRVSLLGGRLAVDSGPERGCRATVTFDRIPAKRA